MSSDVFSALANPTRRDLLGMLRTGPQAVNALASHFRLGRPAISEHLKVLREVGLVLHETRGRERYYQLNAKPLRTVGEWLVPYQRFWRAKLANLQNLLDEEPPCPNPPASKRTNSSRTRRRASGKR